MSAQYRPYRDEESVDGLEGNNWSDNELGTIQIYEKTTEEIPFSSNYKKMTWINIALFIITGVLGFLLGYVVHQKDFITTLEGHNAADHLESQFLFEDPTIKDKLLTQIDGHRMLSLLRKYNDTNRWPGSETNLRFAKEIAELFETLKFDSITTSNFTFKTLLPKQPSVVKLLDSDDKTLYSNLDLESYPHDDMRPFLPLSQAEATTITTDKIVYVNKGLKEDYTKLDALGVSSTELEGKVLVIRQTFYQAHEVVITAQENGAKALLLFPDPDTYGSSSPFPKQMQLNTNTGRSHPTAWGNYGDLATQMGFSLNLSSASGDTSKLGPMALGLDKDSKVIIPIVLISFETASKILRGLSGTPAPSDWNCFDFTLYLGPGYRKENNPDKRDKIKIEFHNQDTQVTSTTVTGVILGSIEPDRYVIIGSRRDSLNRGLLDSVSGSAVMLEIARAFSNLVQQGWRPKRTIVFLSFGTETLNLLGSSDWLESHHRLLVTRAVAYINCDLVVTGNQTASIAASPLLFQAIYNSTRQVTNPNLDENPHLKSVYDVWRDTQRFSKDQVDFDKLSDSELEKNLNLYDKTEPKLTRSAMHQDQHEAAKSGSSESDEDDSAGDRTSILHEYRKSATTKTRPKVRRLDLHSTYSAFFLYAGMPVVDVRYAGFPNTNHTNKSNLIEDTLPFIGTKYDNLATIQMIDPHLKYHIAVAQTLSEIIRDLSDSTFLPFNLLEYAVVLRDSLSHFESHYGSVFNKSNVDLEPLKDVIRDFTKAAIEFHHQQDQSEAGDSFKIRKFNDQLMELERSFLDSGSFTSHAERKHVILTPNEGQEEHRSGFPALVDWITMLEGESLESESLDYQVFVNILKVHYKIVIYTISNAIKVIDQVHVL